MARRAMGHSLKTGEQLSFVSQYKLRDIAAHSAEGFTDVIPTGAIVDTLRQSIRTSKKLRSRCVGSPTATEWRSRICSTVPISSAQSTPGAKRTGTNVDSTRTLTLKAVVGYFELR